MKGGDDLNHVISVDDGGREVALGTGTELPGLSLYFVLAPELT